MLGLKWERVSVVTLCTKITSLPLTALSVAGKGNNQLHFDGGYLKDARSYIARGKNRGQKLARGQTAPEPCRRVSGRGMCFR